MITLYHRKNEIAIDLSDLENIASITIHYTGKIYGESQLSNDWILMANNNKIICINSGDSIPELIMNYIGLMNIKGVNVIDRDLKRHSVNVRVEDVDYWQNIEGDYDKST